MKTICRHMNTKIEMRDGTRLACDIRFPAQGGPFPTILTRTPYGKNYPESELVPFLKDGYAFVTQDVRGKFDSEGEFHPMNEKEDGFDTINWIAAQPWSNGKVGTTGGSYCAFTQLFAACLQPEPLCATTMSVLGNNLFKNTVYRNGVLEFSLVAWLVNCSGRVSNPNAVADWNKALSSLPVCDILKVIGFDVPIFDKWISHQHYDHFWSETNCDAYYEKIETPTYLIGGWYDYYASTTPEIYTKLRKAGNGGRQLKLMMGPWAHGSQSDGKVGEIDFGAHSVIDRLSEKKRWLDHYLGGFDNGIEKEAPVKIFVMGINKWRDEYEWPLERAVETPFYLGSKNFANSLYGNGFLSREIADGKEVDEYVYNPANPVPTIGGNALLPTLAKGPFDQRPLERRDDVLVFTSETLEEPLEATGMPKAELFISSSAPDTDFIARLCDVYPDGRSIQLCEGIARTRFREGLDKEVMMDPGSVYKIEVELEATSNVFLKGHKIRLEVTSSSFPRYSRNLNTGGDNLKDKEFVKATQTLRHSLEFPSRIILPVIPVF